MKEKDTEKRNSKGGRKEKTGQKKIRKIGWKEKEAKRKRETGGKGGKRKNE